MSDNEKDKDKKEPASIKPFGDDKIKEGRSDTGDNGQCKMLNEIHVLYSLIVDHPIRALSPSHIFNKVLPQTDKLLKYSYSDVISPIQHSLEDITQIGISLTASFAATNSLTLIFRVRSIYKAIKEIHSLVKEIKTFADATCIDNVIQKVKKDKKQK